MYLVVNKDGKCNILHSPISQRMMADVAKGDLKIYNKENGRFGCLRVNEENPGSGTYYLDAWVPCDPPQEAADYLRKLSEGSDHNPQDGGPISHVGENEDALNAQKEAQAQVERPPQKANPSPFSNKK